MGFIEDSIVKAREVIDIAGKKTSEAISLQKLKVNASSVQLQISKNYEALGRLYYEMNKNGAEHKDSIAALIVEIDQKTEELSELEAKIANAKGIHICPDCSASNPNTALFCNKCGQKLTVEAEETYTETSAEPAAEPNETADKETEL